MKTRTFLLAAAAFASLAAAAQYDPPRRPPPMIIEPGTVTNRSSHTVGQAEERKFISVGMSRGAVLAKLGGPDRQVVNRVTHLAAQSQVIEAVEDIYEPAPGDPTTRTRIRYHADVVESVNREPVR
jgi:hypothetical protein